MTRRIVISGAPGTGKTSIIKELSIRGYKCHSEISREIIENQLETGGTTTPWQDLDKFSELVIDKRLIQFESAVDDVEFYDRGIIDSLAYLLKDKIPITNKWKSIANNNKYFNTVFITPPWEDIYIKDKERKEDFETATEIHKYMIEAYKIYSYKVCIIPKMSVDERIDFIINQIE
jgi:predicted ATPase